jgi:hypothetical protein
MRIAAATRAVLVVAALVQIPWWIVFLSAGRPLTTRQFKEVEAWRPRPSDASTVALTFVTHRPFFFLARRPIGGGWHPSRFETGFLALHPLGSVPAVRFYRDREMANLGTSLRNADLATLIFVAGALAQWLLLAGAVEWLDRRFSAGGAPSGRPRSIASR